MNDLLIAAEARDDLTNIWGEIARDRDASSADRMNAKILEKCRAHARFPETGRLREDLGRGIRSFPVSPYVVFFRPAEGTIEVLRVIHGRRDVDRIMRRHGHS